MVTTIKAAHPSGAPDDEAPSFLDYPPQDMSKMLLRDIGGWLRLIHVFTLAVNTVRGATLEQVSQARYDRAHARLRGAIMFANRSATGLGARLAKTGVFEAPYGVEMRIRLLSHALIGTGLFLGIREAPENRISTPFSKHAQAMLDELGLIGVHLTMLPAELDPEVEPRPEANPVATPKPPDAPPTSEAKTQPVAPLAVASVQFEGPPNLRTDDETRISKLVQARIQSEQVLAKVMGVVRRLRALGAERVTANQVAEAGLDRSTLHVAATNWPEGAVEGRRTRELSYSLEQVLIYVVHQWRPKKTRGHRPGAS